MMLTDLVKNKTIILASKSPRRKELLAGILPCFKTEVKSVKEIYSADLHNKEIPIYLSQLKASVFKSDIKPNEIIITADTIVCIGDDVLGKPKGRSEALEMLTKLSGNTHEVITGVTLLSDKRSITFHDTTLVTFYDLTKEEIEFYLENNKPYDKAGSYGIQEWIGYVGIKEMKGDYYNVMGLPLHQLYRQLKTFILEELD